MAVVVIIIVVVLFAFITCNYLLPAFIKSFGGTIEKYSSKALLALAKYLVKSLTLSSFCSSKYEISPRALRRG